MKATLLIVDDEIDLLNALENFFKRNGYSVLTAANGCQALELINRAPDLIILDINLPDIDGLAVCRKIRDLVSCPILFLTARISDSDKIAGLKIGGDDYILKPFSILELEARVEAHLRRENRPKEPVRVQIDDDFLIDYSLKEVSFKGSVIPLQKKEFEIVELLSMHPRQLMSRNQIFDSIWSYDSDSDPVVVMAHISSIRAKFMKAGCKPYIQTVWGSGYKWEK